MSIPLNPLRAPSTRRELQGLLDPGEVVVAVAYSMILKHELTGERSIPVQRHRSRAVEFSLAKSADCRRCRSAVSRQECERSFLGDASFAAA